jgi:hypothetical protein
MGRGRGLGGPRWTPKCLENVHLSTEKQEEHLPTQHEESWPVPDELQATSDGDLGRLGNLRPKVAHCACHKPALLSFGLKEGRRQNVLLMKSSEPWPRGAQLCPHVFPVTDPFNLINSY